MKPRTKMHHEVIRLHDIMPVPIIDDVNNFGKTLFKSYGSFYYNKPICLECGSKAPLVTNISDTEMFCSSCNKKLEILYLKDFQYSRIINYQNMVVYYYTIGDYQIIKNYLVTKSLCRNKPASHSVNDFFEIWFNIKKKKVVIYGKLQTNSYYYWNIYGDYEIRLNHDNYNFRNTHPYGDIILHPELLRRGITDAIVRNNENIYMKDIILEVLKDTSFETIVKMFPYLLNKLSKYHLSKLFPQLKICHRNNYIIPNAITYKDYIENLERLGKDTLNPFYICPADLDKAHSMAIDSINARRRRIEEKKRKEAYIKLINEMETDDIEYQKFIKKYKNLVIEKDNIVITPLKSVYEIKEESEILNHCAFINKYHQKKTLLLSCRMFDVRIETAEIALDDPIRIIQCAGHCNEPSTYHDEFVALITNNFHFIKSFRNKRKSKTKSKSPAIAIV